MRLVLLSIVLTGVLSCGGGTRTSGQPAPLSTNSEMDVTPVDEGRCTVDADCVLTEYQSGCCTQACEPYAIHRNVIDDQIANERAACDAFRASGTPCAPAVDCALPTHTVVGAKCVNNACQVITKPGFGRT